MFVLQYLIIALANLVNPVLFRMAAEIG